MWPCRSQEAPAAPPLSGYLPPFLPTMFSSAVPSVWNSLCFGLYTQQVLDIVSLSTTLIPRAPSLPSENNDTAQIYSLASMHRDHV